MLTVYMFFLIQTFLVGASNQFQKLASKAFADILQQELLSVHIYITTCLPTVLKQLESRDTGMLKLLGNFYLHACTILLKKTACTLYVCVYMCMWIKVVFSFCSY